MGYLQKSDVSFMCEQCKKVVNIMMQYHSNLQHAVKSCALKLYINLNIFVYLQESSSLVKLQMVPQAAAIPMIYENMKVNKNA